ncbi:hypothetical protein BGZ46_006818 [Entomortierella lignicola]|nr:hypothetical protein BGZ46_006818 [Entomortierella lignicola]
MTVTSEIVAANVQQLESDVQDEDLDLSSWCVIKSSSSFNGEDSDEESSEVDQDDDEEIYLWQPTSTSHETELPPLRLSLSSDGFTHISKATIAHSTNSVSATAPELRGAWVVKVNKKRSKLQVLRDDLEHKPTTTTTSSNTLSQSFDNSTTQKSLETMNPSEKRKEEVEALELYMSITEHELSKSVKAIKIKKNRVATQHEHDLAKALGCLLEETNKVDKKAIRSRSNAKGKTKSNKASKSKIILPTEF